MSDYGIHPTRYGNLSDEKLYSMYRSSVYGKLNENEKLDLLQETVNRDALERGEVGAPRVEFAELSAQVSGNAAGGVIQVNYDMAVNGRQSFEYNGQTIVHTMDDHNIQALNTVLHENVHCYQDQILDGTIAAPDPGLAVQYQANSFTSSAVLQDGSYRMGSHYLTGESPGGGYYMYYFQATERDAFRMAEAKTAGILQGLTDKYGPEPSFEAYAKGMEANGYAATEQRAIQLFDNPNFERDLNQVLQNQYFGTNFPVDPGTEKAVKGEMTATYHSVQAQAALNNDLNIREEKDMGFYPGPVSLEEYNQSLRDSVNAYYEHAMNDPSMSREEAIGSAAEMSESYLNAVDEFEASQGAQAGVGDGLGADDGLDGGGEDCDGEDCEDDLDI